MLKKVSFILLILLTFSTFCFAKEDLSFNIPREVEVVALGEQSHGSSKMQSLKWDIFEKLLEQGYRNFLIECDYEAGALIDKYINAKIDISANSAVKNANFTIYKTEEMVKVFENMRKYNDNHKDKIRVFGFDILRWKRPLEEFIVGYSKYDKEFSLKYAPIINTDKDIVEIVKNKKELLKYEHLAKILTDRFQADEKAKNDKKLKYLLSVFENGINYYKNTNNYNFRDSVMAKNVMTLSETNEGKSFLIAHDLHVSKDPNTQMMGTFLKDALKEKYYCIGTYAMDLGFVSIDAQDKDRNYKNFNYLSNDKLFDIFKGKSKDILYFETKNKNGYEEYFAGGNYLLYPGTVHSPKLEKLSFTNLDLLNSYDALILMKKDTASKRLN